MCTMPGTSSVRRMCRDTQGIHANRRGGARKYKCEGRGMVKTLGKEDEKKNIGSVENMNHKCIKDT